MNDLQKISDSAIGNLRHTFDKAFYEDLTKRIDGLEDSVRSLAVGINGNKKKIVDLNTVMYKVCKATKNTYEETDRINSFLSGDETVDDLEDVQVSEEFSLAELILVMNQYQDIKRNNEMTELKEIRNFLSKKIEIALQNASKEHKKIVTDFDDKISDISKVNVENKQNIETLKKFVEEGFSKTSKNYEEIDSAINENKNETIQCAGKIQEQISAIDSSIKENKQNIEAFKKYVEEEFSEIARNYEEIRSAIDENKSVSVQYAEKIQEQISATDSSNREEFKQYVERLEIEIKILLALVFCLLGLNIYLFFK